MEPLNPESPLQPEASGELWRAILMGTDPIYARTRRFMQRVPGHPRCKMCAAPFGGIGGPLIGPSAYFMKSPPEQYPDEVARQMVERFIAGEPAMNGNGNGNGSRNGNGKVHLDAAELAKFGTHAH